jgi:1-phosphofructokinase
MIATVTLNPAIDKSMTVSHFEVGKTNRGEVGRTDAGGKGVNVAQAIKRFGLPVCALGLVAGRNGRFLLEALSAAGIPADFITVPGETRVNLKIHDPVSGTETEINEPGFRVSPACLSEMRRKIETYAPRCEVMVFSGSLPLDAPPETFRDFIRIAKNCGAKCILDTAGPALRHGLAAGPWLIKPNRAEVEGLLQKPLRTSHELAEAARTLIAMGTQQVVISLGAEGALGATQDEVLIARAPAVEVQSSIGAGDTMVAVLAFALVEGLPFRQAFRLAVAASAATVAMEGTKVADFAAAQGLVPQVKVEDAVAV